MWNFFKVGSFNSGAETKTVPQSKDSHGLERIKIFAFNIKYFYVDLGLILFSLGLVGRCRFRTSWTNHDIFEERRFYVSAVEVQFVGYNFFFL